MPQSDRTNPQISGPWSLCFQYAWRQFRIALSDERLLKFILEAASKIETGLEGAAPVRRGWLPL
jgi:hypothetical protein